MTKQIAVITHSPYPMEPRARRMAEALAAAGHAVDVFALRYPGEKPQEAVGGVMVYRLPVTRHQGGGALTYLAEYFEFFVLAAWRLLRRHLRRRYALVQVYNPPDILAFCTLPLRLLSGTRVVLDVRDMAPELFMSRFNLHPAHPVTRLLRANERWACAFADAVTVCTTHQFDVMAGRGIPRSRMHIIMNCPDETIFDRPVQARKREGFTVLYHGGVLLRYGLDVLIRAVPTMAAEIPDLRVEIYGMGDYLPQAQRLASDLGLTGVVRFHPRLPLESMPEILRAADVGVAPVRRDVFTDTILPTKLIEYAYMEVPAVAARTSTISEYFADDMAAFFESGDPEDLARQVVYLYRHPDAAMAMAARARRFTEAHNWQHDRAAYLALVSHLIGQPGDGD